MALMFWDNIEKHMLSVGELYISFVQYIKQTPLNNITSIQKKTHVAI
jgi:hypothetical protein